MGNRISFFVIGVFFLFPGASKGQNATANYLPDTSAGSPYVKIMDLWEDYLNSRPDSLYDNPFWNSEEKAAYEQFDFLAEYFSPSTYMGFPARVLSISHSPATGHYTIKSMLSYCREDGSPYVLCIMNVAAKKEADTFKLRNILPYNLKERGWQQEKTRYVHYYFPPNHEFDNEKARKMNHFIDSIAGIFEVPARKIEYFFAGTHPEVMSVLGFDYYVGMGGSPKPTGKVLPGNRIICSGLGEYYPHEVVHIIVDPHYKSTHYWLREGLATFLGGSMGKSLDEIIGITHQFLKDHPKTDLNNPFELLNLNEFVEFRYAIGGLWVKAAYDKGGWPLVKELMKQSTSKQEAINALCNIFGIQKADLSDFTRKKFKEYSRGYE